MSKETIEHKGYKIDITEGEGYVTTLDGVEVFSYDGDEPKEMLKNQAFDDIDEIIDTRLEYLRGEIKAERISYGEIEELRSLASYIKEDDVELLEWAGVPEKAEATLDNSRYHVEYGPDTDRKTLPFNNFKEINTFVNTLSPRDKLDYKIMRIRHKYDIVRDHADIKEQIKEWEQTIDSLLSRNDIHIDGEAGAILEAMSGEMMSINL